METAVVGEVENVAEVQAEIVADTVFTGDAVAEEEAVLVAVAVEVTVAVLEAVEVAVAVAVKLMRSRGIDKTLVVSSAGLGA